MLSKLKALYHILKDSVETFDRLERNYVLLDRKQKLLEQRFDTLFDSAITFMRKEIALKEEKLNAK